MKQNINTTLLEGSLGANGKDQILLGDKENTLWDVFQNCSSWKSKWQKMLTTLKETGESHYHNLYLTMQDQEVTAKTLGKGVEAFRLSLGDNLNEQSLFNSCHANTLALWGALLKPSIFDKTIRAFLGRALISQSPTDEEWLKIVRILSQSTPQTLNDIKQPRYLPRILSERKQALVLVKKGDTWATRNGAPLSRFLHLSKSEDRKKALQVLSDLPCLEQMEIPTSLNFGTLVLIVEEVRKALNSNHPVVRETTTGPNPRAWKLAFRRIQGMGLNGCFDSATQTIIVDPRHMESLKHELCHWLLGHDTTFKYINYQSFENEVSSLEEQIFPS